MMRGIQQVAVLLGLCAVASANPRYGWTRTIGNSDTDFCETVAVASDGGVFVAGDFYGTIDFDPTEGQDVRTADNRDFYVTRFNADGSYAWTHAYRAGGYQNARAIAADSACHVFVTGYNMYDPMDFNPGPGSDVQGGRLFVTKIGCDGSYSWTRTISLSILPNDIAVSHDGTVAVTGGFESSGDFDPGPGVDVHTHIGGEDIFVTKLMTDGSYAWTRTFGSSSQFSNEEGMGVAIAGNGDVVVSGRFRDIVDFDPGPGVDLHGVIGDEGGFVTRFTASGGYDWTRSFLPGSIGKVAIDNAGSIYCTGAVNGTPDALMKFSSIGNVVWTLADPGRRSVTLDRAGYPIVLGGNQGDTQVAKFDPSGNELWSVLIDAAYPGPSVTGYELDVDVFGNVVLAGNFYQAVDFDFSNGVDVHQSAGGPDVFVMRIEDTLQVPATNAWGLAVFVLLLVTLATIVLERRENRSICLKQNEQDLFG